MARPSRDSLDRIDRLVDRLGAARRKMLAEPGAMSDVGLREEIDRLVRASLALFEEAEARETEGPEGHAEVSDVAWLARRDLRRAWEADQQRPAPDPWEALAALDAMLERAERGLVAIEAALLEAFGLPPTDRFRERLKESLEVRRTYAALRRSIVAAVRPRGPDLLRELWLVGTRIEALQRRTTFARLRSHDRRQLQRLRVRIAAATREGGVSDEDPVRLWEDLDGFSQLLMGIHEREDLRRHDLELVRASRRRLAASPGELARIVADLGPLVGRDAELDAVVSGLVVTSAEELSRILMRVEGALDRHPPAGV